MKDRDFRTALIADPTKMVRMNFGLPDGIKLRIVETEPDTTRIVIPHRPKEWPKNLSASDALTRLKQAFGSFSPSVPAVAEAVLGIIAKAMVDEEYAAKLISSPLPIMQEAGVVIPKGVKILVIQEGESEAVVVLPSIQPSVVPTEGELNETTLLLRDTLIQTEMANGSWPFHCTNPDTWCPSCLKA
jgi:hypothetical protein